MKISALLYSAFVWSFVYCHYSKAEASTTPCTVSGIKTVTTGLGLSTTLSSECAFASHTGSINGKNYKAAYGISGETTTSTVAAVSSKNRELKITWYFSFDEPLEAADFSVRQLGVNINSVEGHVDLEEGSFLVTYNLTVPYLTYLTSAIDYCLLEYVAFDFKTIDSNGDNFLYLLHTDNLGSDLVDGLKTAVCDIFSGTNCPLHKAQLPFNCDAFKTFSECQATKTRSIPSCQKTKSHQKPVTSVTRTSSSAVTSFTQASTTQSFEKPSGSAPSIVSGITTVTTPLATTHSFTSQCKFSQQTGSINEKGYKAAYQISGETKTKTVGGKPCDNRVLTVTWFFEFDESLNAADFKVRHLGSEISAIDGSVNLEQGVFIVSYEFTVPLINYLATVVNYFPFEYVAFDFQKTDSAGNDFYYLFYPDSVDSSLVDWLRNAVCDVGSSTDKPLHQAQLTFDCDAFKSFDKCSGQNTLTWGSHSSTTISKGSTPSTKVTISTTSQATSESISTTSLPNIVITSDSTTFTVPSTTPKDISGITTVTTSVEFTETSSSGCVFETQTGSINGKGYHAAYSISSEITTSTVASIPFHNRVLTVTWCFQFEESLDASDFHVRQLGIDISAINGQVNLEQGAFVVSYEVTLPFRTYLASALKYCLLEYVAFDFHKLDSAGNDFYYMLYTENLASALVNGLKSAVCGSKTVSKRNFYQAQLTFECDAFRRFPSFTSDTSFAVGPSTSSLATIGTGSHSPSTTNTFASSSCNISRSIATSDYIASSNRQSSESAASSTSISSIGLSSSSFSSSSPSTSSSTSPSSLGYSLSSVRLSSSFSSSSLSSDVTVRSSCSEIASPTPSNNSSNSSSTTGFESVSSIQTFSSIQEESSLSSGYTLSSGSISASTGYSSLPETSSYASTRSTSSSASFASSTSTFSAPFPYTNSSSTTDTKSCESNTVSLATSSEFGEWSSSASTSSKSILSSASTSSPVDSSESSSQSHPSQSLSVSVPSSKSGLVLTSSTEINEVGSSTIVSLRSTSSLSAIASSGKHSTKSEISSSSPSTKSSSLETKESTVTSNTSANAPCTKCLSESSKVSSSGKSSSSSNASNGGYNSETLSTLTEGNTLISSVTSLSLASTSGSEARSKSQSSGIHSTNIAVSSVVESSAELHIHSSVSVSAGSQIIASSSTTTTVAAATGVPTHSSSSLSAKTKSYPKSSLTTARSTNSEGHIESGVVEDFSTTKSTGGILHITTTLDTTSAASSGAHASSDISVGSGKSGSSDNEGDSSSTSLNNETYDEAWSSKISESSASIGSKISKSTASSEDSLTSTTVLVSQFTTVTPTASISNSSGSVITTGSVSEYNGEAFSNSGNLFVTIISCVFILLI